MNEYIEERNPLYCRDYLPIANYPPLSFWRGLYFQVHSYFLGLVSWKYIESESFLEENHERFCLHHSLESVWRMIHSTFSLAIATFIFFVLLVARDSLSHASYETETPISHTIGPKGIPTG